MDCSLPVSSVPGILQQGEPQWVAVPFSRGSFRPRDQTLVSCIAGRFVTIWATWEALMSTYILSLLDLPPTSIPIPPLEVTTGHELSSKHYTAGSPLAGLLVTTHMRQSQSPKHHPPIVQRHFVTRQLAWFCLPCCQSAGPTNQREGVACLCFIVC